MTEKFYRGGSRSEFSANAWAGAIQLTTQGASSTIFSVPPGSQVRMKRVAVTVLLPKVGGTGATTRGWMAFYRADPDTTTQVSGLAISNPQVLRPKMFMNNSDHAVYMELYLEAITLDGGATLHLMGKNIGGSNLTIDAVAKWYSDASLHY